MSIKKTEVNGKVIYEVFVKTRDKDGKQRGVRRKNIPSFRDAQRLELNLRYEMVGRADKITWLAWTKRFLERFKLEYRNSTYIQYEGKLRLITPVWQDRFIDEITPSDVHDMVFNVVQNVSSYTRWGYLKTIRRIFSVAVEEGVLLRNPSAGIKVKKAEVVQGVLNKTEINLLLKEARSVNHRFFNHWTAALLTGMRSGELCALRWIDLDFDSGLVHITKSWTRFNGEGPTKSGKNRIVPLSAESRKFFAELKLKALDKEFVLPRLMEWERGMAASVLRDFCVGIGITSISFHDLRATFITQLLGNGVSLAKVMTIVGHSSLKTTQGYLRLCGRDVMGATDELNIIVPDEQADGSNLLTLHRKDGQNGNSW